MKRFKKFPFVGVKADRMGQQYEAKIGISFMNYTHENLQKAVNDVKSHRKTLREAAECYGIPKSTLYDKVKGIKTKKHGGQTKLSELDEKKLVDGIITLSEWGFPIQLEATFVF